MKINNISNYNVKPVSFGAKIFKTNCIKEAIDYAKTTTDINTKNKFYNALSMIFNDENMKTFRLRIPKNYLTKILLNKFKFDVDKKVVKNLTYEIDNNLNSFNNCVNALKHFVNKWYGKDALETLSQAKLPGVKKYKELLKNNTPKPILDKQLNIANNDINRQIDIIMLQSRFGLSGE